MLIWLLVLVMLASLAGLGYRQGAIRVGVSFFGILVGTVLAVPLGKLVRPLFVALWVKDPVLAWALPPVVIFVIISLLCKAGAAVLHQKVDVYYKYHAGELRLALWERLNRRLGLCLGLLNATAYLVLISFGIYIFSYWTFQVGSPDKDPSSLRWLNRFGQALQTTGFSKVARSIDSLPSTYYEAADLAGLIYRNPLLEARLGSYPAFLGLAERPEFQSLSGDTSFIQMRQAGEPIMGLLQHPTIDGMVKNPETLRLIWNTVIPDLKDLHTYLETGISPKYSVEPILGRWRFNVNAALGLMRRSKPNISATEMQRIKRWMQVVYEKTSMVAMPDGRLILKNAPQLGAAIGSMDAQQALEGKWKKADSGAYEVSFSNSNMNLTGKIEGDRLTLASDGVNLVFSQEN